MNPELWVSVISGAVSLLGVIGGGTWLTVRQDRKSKELSNEITAISEWQDLYNKLKEELAEKEEKIDKLDNKIDELYKEIKEHRDVKVELRDKIEALQVENTRLKLTHCEVRNCAKRVPPTGY